MFRNRIKAICNDLSGTMLTDIILDFQNGTM
jgi:hypothetical protein